MAKTRAGKKTRHRRFSRRSTAGVLTIAEFRARIRQAIIDHGRELRAEAIGVVPLAVEYRAGTEAKRRS
jgi:hypothetical protein